jgi:hypothetical protein
MSGSATAVAAPRGGALAPASPLAESAKATTTIAKIGPIAAMPVVPKLSSSASRPPRTLATPTPSAM